MAASGVWSVAEAAPAGAYVCAFDIKEPTSGSVSGSATVPFRGAFQVRHGVAEAVLEVTFTSSPGPLPPATVSRRSAVDLAGDYDVPVGPLSLNGAYTARVRAVHTGTSPVLNCDDGLGPERRDTEASAEVRFKVSVQASPPRNVAARFDAGARTATITWERSGDPDVVGYTIIKKVGSAPSTGVSVAAAPLSWTDTNLPSGEATIRYSVQAFRQGPDPGTTSLPSAPVVAAPLAVPGGSAPPPSPSTAPGRPEGPPAPAGGATSTTAPFVLGPPVGGSATPRRAIPFLPFGELRFSESAATAGPESQGDYRPLIPYSGSGGGGSSTQLSDSGDQAFAGRGSTGGERGDGTPGVAYVASGLLGSVVAAHILWLRRRGLRPEPAGAGGHPELETVAPPDPVPPSPAPPPPSTEKASPFERVQEAAAAVAPEDPEAAGRRQPLSAVREPAVAAAAAGSILRPARDGSGTFEPVPPRLSRTAPASRPIVVPAPSAEVASTAYRRWADDETSLARPSDIGASSAPKGSRVLPVVVPKPAGTGSRHQPGAQKPPPVAPLETGSVEPSTAPVPESDLGTTAPVATTGTMPAADDAGESALAGARLRSRLGRSRHRATPWVAAEPVEPARPVEPVPDDEIGPDVLARSGGSATRLPDDEARPAERPSEPDGTAVPSAGTLSVRPDAAVDGPEPTPEPDTGGNRRDTRPVLILRSKGSKRS